MERAEQFRREAASENPGRPRSGWRYPPALRALAVEHSRTAREQGRTQVAIAEELGISSWTLGRWLKQAPRAGFRPVAVVEPVASSLAPPLAPLVVSTPSGLRIEGLIWPQVVELLRLCQ